MFTGMRAQGKSFQRRHNLKTGTVCSLGFTDEFSSKLAQMLSSAPFGTAARGELHPVEDKVLKAGSSSGYLQSTIHPSDAVEHVRHSNLLQLHKLRNSSSISPQIRSKAVSRDLALLFQLP